MDAPANVSRFIDVLGEDLTLDFLLKFGGTPVYLAITPRPNSPVVECVGYDKASKLGRSLGPGAVQIPTAKPWMAVKLKEKGFTGIAIARLLHTDSRTIRRWLNGGDKRQLDLFHQK